MRALALAAGLSTALLCGVANAQTGPAERPAAEAVDPARLAAAREAFAAPGIADAIIDSAMELLVPGMTAQVQTLPDFRPEWAEPFAQAVEAEFRSRRDALVDAMATTHARHLTEVELRDFAAFLRTPGGRAFFARQADLFRDGAIAGAAAGADAGPAIYRRFEQNLRSRGLQTPSDIEAGGQRL